jgi:hypothetical protein
MGCHQQLAAPAGDHAFDSSKSSLPLFINLASLVNLPFRPPQRLTGQALKIPH